MTAIEAIKRETFPEQIKYSFKTKKESTNFKSQAKYQLYLILIYGIQQPSN